MEVFRYGPLVRGYLVKRLNRFVSEVLLVGHGGEPVQCYMANPGSMLGMCIKDAEVRVSENSAPSRKFKFSIEAIKIRDVWIVCNTSIANKIVSGMMSSGALVTAGLLPKFDSFKHEVKEGDTRLDFVAESLDPPLNIGIEVKTVTMASNWYDIECNHNRADKKFHRFPTERPPECSQDETLLKALFPDCESTRALKHVEHLIDRISNGKRKSVLLFVVVRDDVTSVGPSDYCDPAYARALRRSVESGVELVALCFKVHVSDPGNAFITFERPIPICLKDGTVIPTRGARKPKKRIRL